MLHLISIGNHTHSSLIWETIVLAIFKLYEAKPSMIFENCVYNYSPNWTRMCVIAY